MPLLSEILAGTFQGAQGAQGVQGAQGFQGRQGAQGLQGRQGTQGVQGATFTSIPQNSQGAQYTLQSTDSGKHVSITSGGVNVPPSVFVVGDIVTIFNNSTTPQSIFENIGVTLRFAGTSATGNRTLGQYGICNILCVDAGISTTFVISGSGLS